MVLRISYLLELDVLSQKDLVENWHGLSKQKKQMKTQQNKPHHRIQNLRLATIFSHIGKGLVLSPK